MYSVKQLAELAGVTVRTLHHYDALGLLRPSRVGTNGYRAYDEAAVLRLQQILLYREMGFELVHIRDILDQPDFDLRAALRAHRAALSAKIGRLHQLVETVDETLRRLTIPEEDDMSKKDKKPKQAKLDKGDKKALFRGFSDAEQKELEREVRLQYDPTLVDESSKRWASYDQTARQKIFDEGNVIYLEATRLMQAKADPAGAEAQAMAARWHQHLRYFYEPPLVVLRGLGDLYNDDPRFYANISAIGAGLPEYLREVIHTYVDALEHAEAARLLAEDDQDRQAR
jgi:MerR family transcriptional regulator, thiopeptide resistance regulator